MIIKREITRPNLKLQLHKKSHSNYYKILSSITYIFISKWLPLILNLLFFVSFRYNISTDDYDPYNTDASNNGDDL